MRQTFNNIHDTIWLVSKARQVLLGFNTSLELASQQVAFVQKENKLGFGKELGRTYGSP